MDEFQDISRSRARLVRALLAQNPAAQLFAVGDEWQSIYRFAGADVSIMREFGEYFGTTERSDLGDAFRCADRVCEDATRFVTQNPDQLRKSVRSVRLPDHVDGDIGKLGSARLFNASAITKAYA